MTGSAITCHFDLIRAGRQIRKQVITIRVRRLRAEGHIIRRMEEAIRPWAKQRQHHPAHRHFIRVLLAIAITIDPHPVAQRGQSGVAVHIAGVADITKIAAQVRLAISHGNGIPVLILVAKIRPTIRVQRRLGQTFQCRASTKVAGQHLHGICARRQVREQVLAVGVGRGQVSLARTIGHLHDCVGNARLARILLAIGILVQPHIVANRSVRLVEAKVNRLIAVLINRRVVALIRLTAGLVVLRQLDRAARHDTTYHHAVIFVIVSDALAWRGRRRAIQQTSQRTATLEVARWDHHQIVGLGIVTI